MKDQCGPPAAPEQSAQQAQGKTRAGFFQGQVKVWDLGQKRVLRSFSTSFAGFKSQVAFSPDGKRIAWGDGPTVRVADVEGKAEPRVLGGRQQEVNGVAFSPDGTLVAAAGEDGTVVLWNVESGAEELVLPGHTSGVLRVAFNARGDRLAAGTLSFFAAPEVRCWDLGRGPLTRSVRGPTELISLCLAVNRDCTRFLQFTVTMRDGGRPELDFSVRDAASGRLVRRLDEVSMGAPFAEFRPDGSQVASTIQKGAVLSDLASGRQTVLSLPGTPVRDALIGLAYNARGDRLAAATVQQNKEGNKGLEVLVQLYDPDTGKTVGPALRAPVFADRALAERPLLLTQAAFHPDGRRLVVAVGALAMQGPQKDGGGAALQAELHYWDIAAGKRLLVKPLPYLVQALAFHPDGRLVIGGGSSGEGFAELWDLDQGHAVRRFRGHAKAVYAVACHPDGSRLVTGGADQTVKVWDVATGREVLTLRGLGKAATVVRFSPDGQKLVAATGLEFLDLFMMESRAALRVPLEVRVWDAGE